VYICLYIHACAMTSLHFHCGIYAFGDSSIRIVVSQIGLTFVLHRLERFTSSSASKASDK
jgi:hypothetical protein